jgi:hypothetical protein
MFYSIYTLFTNITIYEVKAHINGAVVITYLDFESKAAAEKYAAKAIKKYPHCGAIVIKSQEKKIGFKGV